MKFITPKNELQIDLEEKDKGVLRVAEAMNHLAGVLASENTRFWSVPTERLIAVLNYDVPTTLATFAANAALAQGINLVLDQLADHSFANRAPTSAGRGDITFDPATSQFILIPAAAEAGEPDV